MTKLNGIRNIAIILIACFLLTGCNISGNNNIGNGNSNSAAVENVDYILHAMMDYHFMFLLDRETKIDRVLCFSLETQELFSEINVKDMLCEDGLALVFEKIEQNGLLTTENSDVKVIMSPINSSDNSTTEFTTLESNVRNKMLAFKEKTGVDIGEPKIASQKIKLYSYINGYKDLLGIVVEYLNEKGEPQEYYAVTGENAYSFYQCDENGQMLYRESYELDCTFTKVYYNKEDDGEKSYVWYNPNDEEEGDYYKGYLYVEAETRPNGCLKSQKIDWVDGRKSEYTYDEAGKLISSVEYLSDSVVQEATYDENEHMKYVITKFTDGRYQESYLSEQGNVISEVWYDPTIEEYRENQYYENGNLKSEIIDTMSDGIRNMRREYNYDEGGRKTKEIHKFYMDGKVYFEQSYDEYGNIISETYYDENGEIIEE